MSRDLSEMVSQCEFGVEQVGSHEGRVDDNMIRGVVDSDLFGVHGLSLGLVLILSMSGNVNIPQVTADTLQPRQFEF